MWQRPPYYDSETWRGILARHYGIEAETRRFQTGNGDGELVLPVLARGRGAGRRLAVPPLFPYYSFHYAGTLLQAGFHGEQVRLQLQEQLLTYLQDNFSEVELNLHPDITDVRPFIWAGYAVKVRYTYLLSLAPGGSTPLVADFLARDLARARRCGLEVRKELSTEGALPPVLASFRRNGIRPAFSPEVLADICGELLAAGQLRVFTVREGARVLASLLVLADGPVVYHWLSGMEERAKETGANKLLFVSTIEQLQAEGCWKMLDFWGGDIRAISYFKSAMGGTLQTYFTVSRANCLRGRARRLLACTAGSMRHMVHRNR